MLVTLNLCVMISDGCTAANEKSFIQLLLLYRTAFVKLQGAFVSVLN